jgi:beta-phosphoglucomutase-like phosphatase (HAD superfamily)
VVVEDAAAGIEAARRAGMKCVGVSHSTVLPADVFVGSLTDLPADTFARLLELRS